MIRPTAMGRDTQEVRPEFPVGRGPAGPGDREADRAGGPGSGVGEGTLGNWVNADKHRRGEGNGALDEAERAELARLRKENAELAMERDVLAGLRPNPTRRACSGLMCAKGAPVSAGR